MEMSVGDVCCFWLFLVRNVITHKSIAANFDQQTVGKIGRVLIRI